MAFFCLFVVECTYMCICRYALNMQDKEATDLLLQFLPAVQDWCLKYLHSEPQDDRGNIEFRRYD